MKRKSSMTRAEHYVEAERMAEDAMSDWFTNKERLAKIKMALAQVHATLATADSQTQIDVSLLNDGPY